MIGFKKFLIESRGILHADQVGKQVLRVADKTLFNVASVGVIDNWESFKTGKKLIYVKGKETPSKYYAELTLGKETVWLVSGIAKARPSLFPGFDWPTTNKSKRLTVKPDEFRSITDKFMTISVIRKKLFDELKNHKDLTPAQSDYLCSLFDFYLTGQPPRNFESMKGNESSVLNNFGEITGALWYIKQFSSDGSIFFPSKGNYPLIDSMVKFKTNEIKISSKGGGRNTNTVKGGDVLAIIKELKDKELERNYFKEIELLRILDTNTAIEGVLKGFEFLNPQFAKKISLQTKKMERLNTAKMVEEPIDESIIKEMLSLVSFDTRRAKKDINSLAGLLFLMGKYIQETSKTMKFLPLANDVLVGRVVYVKAKTIDTEGIIHYEYLNSDSKMTVAFLRDKGNIGRLADKIGLQIS